MNESNIIKQSNLTLCFAMLYLNWFKEFGQNFLENYQKFISHLDHEVKINFGIAVLHFKVFAPRWRVFATRRRHLHSNMDTTEMRFRDILRFGPEVFSNYSFCWTIFQEIKIISTGPVWNQRVEPDFLQCGDGLFSSRTQQYFENAEKCSGLNKWKFFFSPDQLNTFNCRS